MSKYQRLAISGNYSKSKQPRKGPFGSVRKIYHIWSSTIKGIEIKEQLRKYESKRKLFWKCKLSPPLNHEEIFNFYIYIYNKCSQYD